MSKVTFWAENVTKIDSADELSHEIAPKRDLERKGEGWSVT